MKREEQIDDQLSGPLPLPINSRLNYFIKSLCRHYSRYEKEMGREREGTSPTDIMATAAAAPPTCVGGFSGSHRFSTSSSLSSSSSSSSSSSPLLARLSSVASRAKCGGEGAAVKLL